MDMTANQNETVKVPWRYELRAMLGLAWPLILASLTQQVIHSTDIILMGRLGEVPLAATTLALNMAFVFNVLLLGLLLAASPMMATALGQRSNAVRDVRRTFRAGLWLLIIAMPPYWLTLWNMAPIMRAFGQSAELAEAGQSFMRAYMWCTAPWLLFQLLRNFVAALERPRLVMWLSMAAILLNALLGWALIFGHFGLPALGIVGGGLGSTFTWLIACGAMIFAVRKDRQFRRFHLFGRFWRFDAERTLAMVRLGWPIGLSMALEVGVFALAAYF
ncbi:MAG TPA: MATE family efflux transporter, partial [Sphingomicrobium sp.]|nr:MATE family efflux transporter [Sphingomicrobium sp.]